MLPSSHRLGRPALAASVTALLLALFWGGLTLLQPRTALAAEQLAIPLDGTYQPLPFAQNWSNTGLITANDNWSGVPGIIGYLGNYTTSSPVNVDPQTLLGDFATNTVDVIANQTNTTLTDGGVAEFQITNPVVALQGSAAADAPHLVLHLNTTGASSVRVQYNVRDIDVADNAVQQVALQYRVGTSGNFTNVPAAYILDATTANTATLVTAVDVTLPAAAANQPQVQLRIMTTNATGSDEWVGIDDIQVTDSTAVQEPELVVDKSGPAQAAPGATITYTLSIVNSGTATAANVRITDTLPAGTTYVSYSSSRPLTFTNIEPTLIWQTAALTPSSAITISLRVQVPNPFTQPITNTVRASTTTVGDDPANNTDLAVTSPIGGGACGTTYTPIYAIQGSGGASPFPNGTDVTTEGVVVGDFQGVGQLNGFFLQEPAGDGNPATSDGIFVFATTPNVAVGDRVRVTGDVTEFVSGSDTLTEIVAVTGVLLCGTGTVAPTAIDLPIPSLGEWERYEGMLVTFPETLYVTEHFNVGRFGEVSVSSDGRLFQPTEVVEPGAPASAMQALNDRSRVLLDDGSNTSNPTTVPYLAADNTLRIGDTAGGITGALSYGFSTYRLQPTQSITFARANPRPTPPAVMGTLKVASFNVLNFFTTIDVSSTGCGPAANQDCRGADSAAELTRQRAKLVQALLGLNADVIGLIELENNAGAIQDLVNTLNISATSPYAIAPGYPANIGTDAIKVGIIYRPSSVTPVGNVQIDNDAIFDRPPVAQTFQNPGGARFTFVINHFKSKGSCPSSGVDADQGDGQSCWNNRRVLQAQRLITFVNTLVTSSGDPDVLLMGDLNAYSMEDPIDTLEAANFTNVGDVFIPAASSYSFVFQAQSGELDHALSSAALTPQVVDADIWHINADEPIDLDYNDDVLTGDESVAEFNQPYLYQPNAFRSSDHDPMIVGLSLTPLAVTLSTFEAAPEADAIRARWETALETEAVGFNLLRGDDGTAPMVQVNGSLIPATGSGSQYSLLDEGVQANSTYFYWLEVVATDGTTTRHGPVSATAQSTSAVTLGHAGTVPSGTPLLSLAVGSLLLLAAAGFLYSRSR